MCHRTRLSPLLIGEVFPTRDGAWQERIRDPSQSPLHRGGLSDSGHTATRSSEKEVSQSPLHRGGLSDSDKNFQKELFKCLSPLFIGEVFPTFRFLLQSWRSASVSVPSSSGRSFRRRHESTGIGNRDGSQSPLHRGGLSDRAIRTSLPFNHLQTIFHASGIFAPKLPSEPPELALAPTIISLPVKRIQDFHAPQGHFYRADQSPHPSENT